MLGLAVNNGKQPPIANPNPTPPANTKPQGRSIDLHVKNFRLTKLAFCTDNNAIAIIHTAEIVEMSILIIRTD